MKKYLRLVIAVAAVLVMYSCSHADTFYINEHILSDAQVGKHASYRFTVTDLGGKSTAGVEWSISGFIPGMSSSNATATLSGTPTKDGYYSLTVTAKRRYSTDYTPASDKVNFTLRVKAADRPNPSSDDDNSGENNDDSGSTITIDETTFPDAAFRGYVSLTIDTNPQDGCLSTSEIASTTHIYAHSKGITSLKGIEYFTALTYLSCWGNQLTEINVSNNLALTELRCYNNQLTTLNLRTNTDLKNLWCYNNQLTTLDVSHNVALTWLRCDNNQLKILDISKNTALKDLECDNNQLTYIVKGCVELETFVHDDGVQIITGINAEAPVAEINEMNFPDAAFRKYVSSTHDKNRDGCLGTSEIANSTLIKVSNKGISSLKGIEYFTALTELWCDRNQLTALDVSKNIALTELWCYSNQLKTLDLSKNPDLMKLSCRSNQLTELDVSHNTALTVMTCSGNQLKTLDVSNNTALTELYCKSNQLTELDVSHNTALTTLDCSSNQLTSIIIAHVIPDTFSHDSGVQIIDINNIAEINAQNFPDPAFREYVSSNFDKDGDDYLNILEVATATTIDVDSKGITSLKGIEYFTVLKNLYCSNNQLTELDVSGCTALTYLYCYDNNLTSLNVNGATALRYLSCWSNQLTTLDVSANTALQNLSCSNNQLTELDVSGCTALTWLSCESNQLTKLDVSGCTQLESLYCSNNKLTELDVRKNTALTYLYCENNPLTDSNTILIISPETFPDGKVGTDYSAKLSANLSGVTWSASGLPSWLNIYASTGELYGKPTTGGTYTFTVTASLSSLKASKTYTLNISAGQNTPQPEFRTHSLVLSGQIGVNFFMYLPEISGIDYTKSYVEFDINGDKSNPPQYFDPTFKNSKGTYYGFRCYIKSIQMADKITATFHYGNNQTVTHEYSAKKYLDDSLAANISSEERALIEAIKDYGHYAQLYLSSIHTWELGRDYAAIDCENDYSAADIETVRKAVAGNAIVRDTGTASGVQRVGFSLSLDSDTNINLYIYPASGYTGAVSATLSGSNENLAVYQSNRNRYEVKISNISAHKLSDTYTVRVKAQKDFDVKVSAFSYVCDALNDSAASESERKAVVSLYKYYVTTMGYRAATGQ